MIYPLLIGFSLAPSFIWLLFFLRKDSHPESNTMVLKIFLYGMLATIPTALVEIGFSDQLTFLPAFLLKIVYVFVGIALVEEGFKYLVVKKAVFKNSEFDEPTDIILYMIISALGFAALENIFVFLPMANSFRILDATIISAFRFVGATFLHALCSGLIGYYLALSFFHTEERTKLVIKGIVAAVLLHGLYDFSIMEIEGGFKFVIPIIILVSLAGFVSLGFKKVKALKSVCKIKK